MKTNERGLKVHEKRETQGKKLLLKKEKKRKCEEEKSYIVG